MAKKSSSKAAKSTKAGGAKTRTAKAKPATISKKARQAGTLKALEAVGTQGLNVTKSSQRKASAAVKATRIAIKGLSTRRVGHSQAQTARSQVQRDRRNASR